MISWLNENAGFVSVLIFIASLLFGWVTGIFKSIIRKPKFRVEVRQGPTFSSTSSLGEIHKGFDVHRTAIALYLQITNIGNAPAQIQSVAVGYHCHIKKFGPRWIRYRLFWHWLKNQNVILDEFQHEIGEKIKLYPLLFQRSIMDGKSKKELYLKEGEGSSGVVYFESQKCYGDHFPLTKKKQTKIIVCVKDSYKRKYYTKIKIPVVSMEYAKQYNKSFGETFAQLNETQKNPSNDS